MPSPPSSQLPKPRNWEDFEDLVSDLFKEIWRDPYVTRYGRLGQSQFGIDIVGSPGHLSGSLAAIQCKKTDALTIKEVDDAIDAATLSPLPLAEFVLCSTSDRDARVQDHVLRGSWKFRTVIQFWEDIALSLAGHPRLLEKHFPGWKTTSMSLDKVWDILFSADPEEFLYDDDMGVFVYKPDISLRIILDRSEDSSRSFQTKWTECFPNPVGHLDDVYVHYGVSRILTQSFCWVDGARHVLPLPESESKLRVNARSVHLARIISRAAGDCEVDHALHVAGFEVLAPE